MKTTTASHDPEGDKDLIHGTAHRRMGPRAHQVLIKLHRVYYYDDDYERLLLRHHGLAAGLQVAGKSKHCRNIVDAASVIATTNTTKTNTCIIIINITATTAPPRQSDKHL